VTIQQTNKLTQWKRFFWRSWLWGISSSNCTKAIHSRSKG